MEKVTIHYELGDEKIPWHPAFIEALQAELEEYQDSLEFYPEYQLTSEPLRIDCVVIKKTTDVVMEKNIATIFREWNLLEYKSPDDYVSVAYFYKVYGYACLYASFKRVPITSLTLSFVGSHFPRKLLSHLKNERGYTLAEKWPGVYIVNGDVLPIQIIDSRKLSAEQNLWLKNLSKKHNWLSFDRVSLEIDKRGKTARLGAYLNAITLANPEAVKEAYKMGKRLKLYEVLKEAGITDEWEAIGRAEGEVRGRAEEAFSIAQNLAKLGIPVETVISATQIDPEKVKTLYRS